jgi:Zn finger protein HypA/HybF involved in hydrogenase expression
MRRDGGPHVQGWARKLAMGDVADMMIDGTLCEGCGVFMEGEALGVPRRCVDCKIDDTRPAGQSRTDKVSCPTCGKRVKATGLKDHERAVHASSQGQGSAP